MMNNIKVLASAKIAFFLAVGSAYGQSELSAGGYAGIARFIAEESERLGYSTKEQAEEIANGYENAQEFLGQAFTRGQTVGRANPAQGAINLGIGVARNALEETAQPEQPVRTTTTTDLPEISEDISVPQREPSSPPLSNAAEYLVNQHIENGCEQRGGTFDRRGITIRDLDGDGRDDLILADEWIVCNGARQQSITCGVKVCEAVIYVRRGAILERSASFNGTGIEVASGRRPTVTFLEHNLSTFSFGWNGNSFAQR